MLYTIIDINSVFYGDSAECTSSQAYYKGQNIMTVADRNGNQTISRLLSTDPYVYLNKEYCPGNYI